MWIKLVQNNPDQKLLVIGLFLHWMKFLAMILKNYFWHKLICVISIQASNSNDKMKMDFFFFFGRSLIVVEKKEKREANLTSSSVRMKLSWKMIGQSSFVTYTQVTVTASSKLLLAQCSKNRKKKYTNEQISTLKSINGSNQNVK